MRGDVEYVSSDQLFARGIDEALYLRIDVRVPKICIKGNNEVAAVVT